MDKRMEDEYKYQKDTRLACKYGIQCYQKNSAHIKKFKHPPKNYLIDADDVEPPSKKQKLNKVDVGETRTASSSHASNDESKIETNTENTSYSSNEPTESDVGEPHNAFSDASNDESKNDINIENASCSSKEPTESDVDLEYVPSTIDEKEFIKSKFLVEMPADFFNFWNFCKNLNAANPLVALKNVGLALVGPFEILANKFCNTQVKTIEEYVLHWRYYYDPPEFQTVIKKNDNSGYHLGYFRDSPDQMPVFLAYNFAKTDGTFTVVGDNLFAAVSSFLKFSMKNANPFTKMSLTKYNTLIQKEGEKLKLNLSTTTPKITARNKKIASRTFNKLGIVVPYNKSTQVGYRPLSMSNKELAQLLSKIDVAQTNSERDQLMVQLQDVLTCTNIALDECDFGTGLELGLDILCSGVESLNSVAARFLSNSYRLLNREAFAIIIESHMKKRQKDFNKLSII